jgi:hypothetical protein
VDMQVVVICEMFGWTYDEYLSQPIEFLELIREKMKIDAQKAENIKK